MFSFVFCANTGDVYCFNGSQCYIAESSRDSVAVATTFFEKNENAITGRTQVFHVICEILLHFLCVENVFFVMISQQPHCC